jgi:hypothetical protein
LEILDTISSRKKKKKIREGEGKNIRDDGSGEEDSLSTQGEVAPTDLHYLVPATTGIRSVFDTNYGTAEAVASR